MEIVATQSVRVWARRWQISGDEVVAVCSSTVQLKKGLGNLLPRNLQYLGLSAELRAPLAVVRKVKQQGPVQSVLSPQHSIHFCFEKGGGEIQPAND